MEVEIPMTYPDKLMSVRAPIAHGFIVDNQLLDLKKQSKMPDFSARLNYKDNLNNGMIYD